MQFAGLYGELPLQGYSRTEFLPPAIFRNRFVDNRWKHLRITLKRNRISAARIQFVQRKRLRIERLFLTGAASSDCRLLAVEFRFLRRWFGLRFPCPCF